MSYADMVKRSGGLQSAFTAVARIPKPVVAAITGYALGGGCELALCADVRFAAEDAALGQPEILLGIIPGAGGTQRLTRLVGPSRAKDLIFTGRFVKADEALAIGLVDRVVPADAGVRRGGGVGAAVRRAPRRTPLRAAKEAIDRGLEVDLDTGLEIERQQFAALFATEDRAHRDGVVRRERSRQGGVRGALMKRQSRRARRPPSRSGGAERCRDPGPAGPGPVVWLVCVLAALFLAVGALLVALRRQPATTRWSSSSCDGADARRPRRLLAARTASRSSTATNAATKNALFNWGLGAVVWLVVGRILDRIVRP